MKRAMPWSDEEEEEDDTSSSSDDTDDNLGSANINAKHKSSQVDSAKRNRKGVDFEALSRHGYKGGLSVLKVPPPKEPEQEQNWSWSSGKETREKEKEETYEERQKTRASLAEAEELVHARTQKEKKNFSFSQKEKRKRDLGQASRGKSYVEEEKRLLRDNGVYSGFDS
ncbi:protein C1orf52 [Capsicum chacoense]